MFTNSLLVSNPDLFCLGAFIIVGISIVLAIRNVKKVVAGCITLPLALGFGGICYVFGRSLYGKDVALTYGLAGFAIAGLILVSALRWLASLDAY